MASTSSIPIPDALGGTDAEQPVNPGVPAPATAAPHVPMDPSAAAALGGDFGVPPLVFGGRVAQGANNAAQGANMSKPGAWSRGIMSGVMDALSGFVAGGGAGPQAAANVQRIQARNDQQRQQAIENQQKQQQLNSEIHRNDILNAYTTAATIADQKTAARLDDESMAAHVQAGKVAADAFKDHPLIADGVTEDEALPEFKTGGKFDPHNSVGFQTGTAEVVKNGKMVLEPTYTVYARQAGDVTVSDAVAELLKKNGQPLPAGTKLNSDLLNHLTTEAIASQTTTNLINKGLADDKKNQLDLLQTTGKVQDMRDRATVNPWLGAHPGEPLIALSELSNQVDPKTKRPTPQAVAASRLLSNWDPKELETYRHDKAEEALKQHEIDAEYPNRVAGGNAVNTVTPEMQARINALPAPAKAAVSRFDPDTQASLMSVAFGENDLDLFPQRLTKGAPGLDRQTAAGIIQQINPAFDPTRAGTYKQARKDFSAGGKDGTAINRLNTAIEHLSTFNDSSQSWLSTLPAVSGFARLVGTQNANTFQTAKTALAEEIAAAYKGQGAPTEQEIKNWENQLDGSTPVQVKAKVQAALGLLESKRDSYNYQWKISGVPGTNPPMQIVSPEAQAAASKIRGVQAQQTAAPAAQAIPAVVQGVLQAAPVGRHTLSDGSIWDKRPDGSIAPVQGAR